MSINVNYYGQESTWINMPMSDNMGDRFMLGSYSDVIDSTYGLGCRTWLATKYGTSYETYTQNLDNSYGYCITDGTAPFDNITYCTGYNNNYPNRIKTTNTGRSTVGFAGLTFGSPYLGYNYVQYFKTSNSDSSTYSNVALNFNPPYPFSPNILTNGDFKYMSLSKGNISPALKYTFNNFYAVPFVRFGVLKTEYGISDIDSVTDPINYSNLFNGTYVSDLKRFYNDINSNVFSADKVVIMSIYVKILHVKWNTDGTYDYDDIEQGTQSTTKCIPIPFFKNNSLTELTFTDWYKSSNADTFTINIDTSFISHHFVSLGTNVRLWNGKENTASVGTVSNATVIAGQRNQYGTLYDSTSEYPYVLTPCAYDTEHFTVKYFEEYEISSSIRKHAVSVYTSLNSFGGLDEFREYVRKSIAYLGCYFSECFYPNATREWNTNDCFIGTIDGSGVTHGEYTFGTGNEEQQQYTWADEWSDKTPYTPDTPSPIEENDIGDLITHLNSGTYVTSAEYYATTSTEMQKFIKFINTYSPTEAELTADFKGVNPSDYVTNVLYFPFNVSYSGPDIRIFISTLDTTATGYKFAPSYGELLADFGSITIERYFNDFRDFAPYTKLTLNIPFSTSVDLDISEFYGHNLGVKSSIDFTTGDMFTLIMRDNLVVKTVTGNCAIQLPISALAMGTYQQTLNTLNSNAVINTIQTTSNDMTTTMSTGVAVAGIAMSGGMTALTNNPVNTVVSGISQHDILQQQAAQIDYAIQHTAPTPINIVGGTPCNMAMLEYLPRYTITRCKTLNNINHATYGKTVGYATVQQGKVSDFSGLIVCSDVEFDNISATETEQNIIKNLLKSGVVV